MKVGCGFVEKQIHGKRYLYFWSFQGRGTGARKVEIYVGPAADPTARRKTLSAIETYCDRMRVELERRVARWRRELTNA